MSYFLGVDTSSGRAVIPKELDWTEYRNSVAINYGLLHRYLDVETIVQNGGLHQSDLKMPGCSTK
jgi:hypothetical protein